MDIFALKHCGRELDDESTSELVGLFRLLDKWDREWEEQSQNNRTGIKGTTILPTQKQPEKLGSIMGQISAENRIKP